jgi:hypothetical protein
MMLQEQPATSGDALSVRSWVEQRLILQTIDWWNWDPNASLESDTHRP